MKRAANEPPFFVLILPGGFKRLIQVSDQIAGGFDTGWMTSERAS